MVGLPIPNRINRVFGSRCWMLDWGSIGASDKRSASVFYLGSHPHRYDIR